MTYYHHSCDYFITTLSCSDAFCGTRYRDAPQTIREGKFQLIHEFMPAMSFGKEAHCFRGCLATCEITVTPPELMELNKTACLQA